MKVNDTTKFTRFTKTQKCLANPWDLVQRKFHYVEQCLLQVPDLRIPTVILIWTITRSSTTLRETLHFKRVLSSTSLSFKDHLCSSTLSASQNLLTMCQRTCKNGENPNRALTITEMQQYHMWENIGLHYKSTTDHKRNDMNLYHLFFHYYTS